MKRLTISLPDDLVKALLKFQASQTPQKPISDILRDALRVFLQRQGFLSAPKITPSRKDGAAK